jgi:hypothetical protein
MKFSLTVELDPSGAADHTSPPPVGPAVRNSPAPPGYPLLSTRLSMVMDVSYVFTKPPIYALPVHVSPSGLVKYMVFVSEESVPTAV